MADIKIAGRIKAGAADGISGYASEILFDDAASNKTVKEKIEEAASSPQTMIVTISPDGNDGYEADKTFAEIKAFIDNGGTVIAKDEEDGDSYYYLDNCIASEVVFTRNIWGSGGFSTRYYTIDNTNAVSFIDSVHHISSAVDSSSTANLANSAAVKALRDSMSEIKSISVNNTEQQVDQEGNVDIAVPTSLADLAGDSTHRTVTDAEKSTWNGKQNALTFDNVPTANSNNPVKSGGIKTALDAKQDTISDIATIRSNAAAGATAYQKPGTGIPKTDFASAVQTSLGKADTAIQSVAVGTTTTGAAGSSASVTNTGTATEPVLSFTIPQGAQGIQGIQGPQGERGPQGNTGVQVDSVASIIHSIEPTATYAAADVAGADAVQDVLSEITELSGELDDQEAVFDSKNELINNSDDTYYIADGNGNLLAKFDANGLSVTDVKVLQDNNLVSLLTLIGNNTTALSGKVDKITGKGLSTEDFTTELKDKLNELVNNGILQSNDDALYITDRTGYVVAYVDDKGIHSVNFQENSMLNQWNGKKIATYGDSVTALNGGDFSVPYSSGATSSKWAGKVAKYFNFAALHNRGIGSTCFKYRNNGGQVAWVNTTTGVYVNRNDNYNYDNYEGHVTIPDGCTAIRGDGSSWLRIKSMFPSSIKDIIDVVLIQFQNDFHYDLDTDAEWIEGDTTDPEWSADTDYYSVLGGDYNINSVKGGIASTIMKLQAWMPQALLVLMTPISGVYINGNEDVYDLENPESVKMKKLAEVVKDIAFRMSVPCIDVYGNDCINSLNKQEYITDGIHPYNDAGCKKIARAIIGSLISIIPNIE